MAWVESRRCNGTPGEKSGTCNVLISDRHGCLAGSPASKNTSCIANRDIHELNHNTASVPFIDHELVAEGSCSISPLSHEVHIVPYVVHLETDDGRVVNAREGGALWLNPRISPGPHPQRQSRPNPY